jgi:pimeloyl-ACP methyl ester carboxylesterase
MIRRVYVDGRWGQAHATIAGDDKAPPLLLLHQSPLSGEQFLPALPLLAQAGLRAIALDTAGFGRSDPPPAPMSVADHAEALLVTMDALGLKRAHLLGHHTGAMIAANFAARFPQRADRLALNGVPLFSAAERAHFAAFDFRAIEPLADGSHLQAAWNQRLAASPGWTDLKAMHRHVVAWLANPDRAHWGFQMAFAHDLEADLSAIVAPTLILTNTGEDLFEASRRAHALRPDWAFAALEGGTHDVVDEMPDAWAAAVAGWVALPRR